MGRDNVPQVGLNESPSRSVTVRDFFIDRTEITTAEYAQCVSDGACEPPDGWAGAAPPPGADGLPVTNVSQGNAREFAAWRSRRDGVAYRLPTEEEWEYAARGGGNNYLYPWGSEWSDGRANVGGGRMLPAGSLPEGASPAGVLDLIGNVWEWTSSPASVYPGNDAFRIPPSQQGQIVIRGGSYNSRSQGNGAVTSTTRMWVPPETKNPLLGFRLVRDGS